MGSRSASALASLLLTNRLVDVEAKPLSAREYWPLIDLVKDPALLLGRGVGTLVQDSRVAPDLAGRVARLLDAGTALAVEVDHLEQQGILVVSPFDGAYPGVLRDRLAGAAPPVLYVAGSPGLLGAGGVAVVGSRDVSDTGAEVARTVGAMVAAEGSVLVSGGARGVDELAMDAALQAGGTAAGVLADALTRRLRKPDVRRAVTAGDLCLASPYKPSAGFSVARAMARNKIVYALARTTFVVAADAGRGGTWEGAVEALRTGVGRVAVWTGDGSGDGNPLLVERGAHPVDSPAALLAPSGGADAPGSGQLSLKV